MAKVTLFVAWVEDFAEDIKKYGLEIIKEVDEEPGFMVTIKGPKKNLMNFLEIDYCMGMDDECKQEVFKDVKYQCTTGLWLDTIALSKQMKQRRIK